MPTLPLIFHSRPRAEADWRCQRYRYYAYDFEGGIVKDNLTLDLFIGTCLHDALAAIATQHRDTGKVDIDQIATVSRDVVTTTLSEYYGELPDEAPEALLTKEQSSLVEGLIRAFYKHKWPALIEKYPNIIGIEQECIFPHGYDGKLNLKGPFVFMAKPDLIVEGPDGLVYIEYKSTGSKKLEWVESWNHATQVHATQSAIEFTLKRPVLGSIVQGLYKGSTMYGKYSSQLVYLYEKKGNPPFSKTILSSEWKAGMKKVPIWELDGGMQEWIKQIPPETLSEQLLQTPLIFRDEDQCQDFFRQRATREVDIKVETKNLASDDLAPDEKCSILDETFPQSFDKCSPSFGDKCAFLRICHGPAKEDPLSFGYIKKNRDHEQPYYDLAKELLA